MGKFYCIILNKFIENLSTLETFLCIEKGFLLKEYLNKNINVIYYSINHKKIVGFEEDNKMYLLDDSAGLPDISNTSLLNFDNTIDSNHLINFGTVVCIDLRDYTESELKDIELKYNIKHLELPKGSSLGYEKIYIDTTICSIIGATNKVEPNKIGLYNINGVMLTYAEDLLNLDPIMIDKEELDIDKIFDKIFNNGIDSISPTEKMFLEKYSKTL